jgi:hypothetical protein
MMPVVDQDILAIENEDSCSIDVDIADNLKILVHICFYQRI